MSLLSYLDFHSFIAQLLRLVEISLSVSASAWAKQESMRHGNINKHIREWMNERCETWQRWGQPDWKTLEAPQTLRARKMITATMEKSMPLLQMGPRSIHLIPFSRDNLQKQSNRTIENKTASNNNKLWSIQIWNRPRRTRRTGRTGRTRIWGELEEKEGEGGVGGWVGAIMDTGTAACT